MNIFDLADLDDDTARALVGESLRRFPEIAKFYDDAFLRRLVPRRHNLDNFLLLLLVQPEDEYAQRFWTSTIADLTLLQDEGAWERFKPKFRRHEQFDIGAAKSELSLAAWLKRRGHALTLEPRANGERLCEFKADTSPRTWWEVKSMRDIGAVEQNQRVHLHVQHRLRRIPQPYILSLDKNTTLALADVAPAVRDIKRQIKGYYESGGAPPKSFESRGLHVSVTGVTKRSYGYLGTSLQSYTFGSEQMKRVLSRILSARAQLPPESAGVVVIDATMAQWLHDHDVIDACFGEEFSAFGPSGLISVRKPGGAFDEGRQTRISAVIYYTRTPDDWNKDFEMIVLHNPFASVPLRAETLHADGVRQLRRFEVAPQTFRLEEDAT